MAEHTNIFIYIQRTEKIKNPQKILFQTTNKQTAKKEKMKGIILKEKIFPTSG